MFGPLAWCKACKSLYLGLWVYWPLARWKALKSLYLWLWKFWPLAQYRACISLEYLSVLISNAVHFVYLAWVPWVPWLLSTEGRLGWISCLKFTSIKHDTWTVLLKINNKINLYFILKIPQTFLTIRFRQQVNRLTKYPAN